MPFDPQQWLAAVDAYHRREHDGAGAPADGARHCFGCGETYLALPEVWEHFPDPANPYALCRDCRTAHTGSATARGYCRFQYRLLSRKLVRNRLKHEKSSLSNN